MRNRTLEKQHFELLGQIQEAYQAYNQHQGSLHSVTALCQKQIKIAPQVVASLKANLTDLNQNAVEHGLSPVPQSVIAFPGHEGFLRLYEIRKEQRRFAEALVLAKQAKAQGWAGDWDKAIAESENKLRQQMHW